MHFVVRSATDPLLLAGQLRAAVHSFDRSVPVAEMRSLDDLFASSTETSRVITLLLTCFAALGLCLGAVGIYGVISYTVGQRTRELGIRTALGALEGRITVMIVAEGLRTAGVGILIGVAVALLAGRAIASLLFEVTATDPLIYGGVVGLLLVVVLAATYFPARRAARVDPLCVMRDA